MGSRRLKEASDQTAEEYPYGGAGHVGDSDARDRRRGCPCGRGTAILRKNARSCGGLSHVPLPGCPAPSSATLMQAMMARADAQEADPIFNLFHRNTAVTSSCAWWCGAPVVSEGAL